MTTGIVSLVAGDWLQITSDQYIVDYIGLQNIRVSQGMGVAAGDVIAEAGPPESIMLKLYQMVDPTPQLMAARATDEMAGVEGSRRLRLISTVDGLRVRETPVDGKPVGTLKTNEEVESLETPEETLARLGVEGQWLRIRRADGTEAYAAAWFLVQVPDSRATQPSQPIVDSLLGMNLDMNHPQGRPTPADLQGVGWLRVKFNVSYNPENGSHGNRDIEAAYQRYLPFIRDYAQAGMRVLMVFTHQLYGEGAGFDWTQMDSGRWRQLSATYADFARQVAQRFSGSGLVHAYQIWNEQDTRPENARAAVPIPAADYAHLLSETIQAIRQVDAETPIITGGHTSGPTDGVAYARETLAHMPDDLRPDGIAFHPYGRGVKGQRFSNFGDLGEAIAQYEAVLPGQPVWITEWGVQDHQGRADVIGDVLDYATGFMRIAREDYAGQGGGGDVVRLGRWHG